MPLVDQFLGKGCGTETKYSFGECGWSGELKVEGFNYVNFHQYCDSCWSSFFKISEEPSQSQSIEALNKQLAVKEQTIRQLQQQINILNGNESSPSPPSRSQSPRDFRSEVPNSPSFNKNRVSAMSATQIYSQISPRESRYNPGDLLSLDRINLDSAPPPPPRDREGPSPNTSPRKISPNHVSVNLNNGPLSNLGNGSSIGRSNSLNQVNHQSQGNPQQEANIKQLQQEILKNKQIIQQMQQIDQQTQRSFRQLQVDFQQTKQGLSELQESNQQMQWELQRLQQENQAKQQNIQQLQKDLEKARSSGSNADERHYGIVLFRLGELVDATNNFSNEMIIGRGGYGPVYRCTLRECDVAIKRMDREGTQGEGQFMNEASILGTIRHVNILPLRGLCLEKGQLSLIYHYMPNRSLDDRLHSSTPLDWKKRIEISLGAARGLAYLHCQSGHKPEIWHRDMKSANILLDSNLNPRIGDLGLAKIAELRIPGNTNTSPPQTTSRYGVIGTPGYIDPEYASTQRYCSASDTFGFGVVLLEMITGLRAWQGDLAIPDLARRVGRMFAANPNPIYFVDQRAGKWIPRACDDFLRIAFACIQPYSHDRPTMDKVVEKMEEALNTVTNMWTQERQSQILELKECIVCMEAPKGTIRFLPCFHAVTCRRCSRDIFNSPIRRCPVCHVVIQAMEQGTFNSYPPR